MKKEQIEEYIHSVHATSEEAKSFGVEVLCGIEAEVFPDEEELEPMDEILSKYKFDFVLGSLHAQCESYIKWLNKNMVNDDAMRIDCYFRHLRDGVISGRYDSCLLYTSPSPRD